MACAECVRRRATLFSVLLGRPVSPGLAERIDARLLDLLRVVVAIEGEQDNAFEDLGATTGSCTSLSSMSPSPPPLPLQQQVLLPVLAGPSVCASLPSEQRVVPASPCDSVSAHGD